MNQPDNQPPITIEVPATTGNYTPLQHTLQQSRMEAFRRGWCNALALPDNFTDLIYDVTASVAIPALVSSAWGSLPLPEFIRFGALVTVVIAAAVLWQLSEIPEVKAVLAFRLVLFAVGVILGL